MKKKKTECATKTSTARNKEYDKAKHVSVISEKTTKDEKKRRKTKKRLSIGKKTETETETVSNKNMWWKSEKYENKCRTEVKRTRLAYYKSHTYTALRAENR